MSLLGGKCRGKTPVWSLGSESLAIICRLVGWLVFVSTQPDPSAVTPPLGRVQSIPFVSLERNLAALGFGTLLDGSALGWSTLCLEGRI